MTGRHAMSLGPKGETESGAVLVLALIFVIIMAVSLIAVVNLAGDALISTAKFTGQRSLQYAADAATDAAVEAVRYSYYAFDGKTNPQNTGCVPDGAVLTVPDNATMPPINGIAMNVTCSGVPVSTPPLQNTRTVTFYSCQQGLGTCNAGNAVVVAQVIFQDYSAVGIYSCSATTGSATCGTGEAIQSWVVQNSNS
jgi:hypothetical protein